MEGQEFGGYEKVVTKRDGTTSTLARLDEQIVRLGKGLDDLRSRLVGVLRNVPPSDLAIARSEAPSGLAAQVQTLDELNDSLAETISRIDL